MMNYSANFEEDQLYGDPRKPGGRQGRAGGGGGGGGGGKKKGKKGKQ